MYLKKIFILLIIPWSASNYSMQHVKTWRLGQFSKGLKGKPRPRQTKTAKTKKLLFSSLFKKFHKKFSSKNTSYKQQKAGKNKFAAVPTLAITAGFTALNISDEEKKEDNEELKNLLSAAYLDEVQRDRIRKLLEKYGYTEEVMYALLEGLAANRYSLYYENAFVIDPLEKGLGQDKGLLELASQKDIVDKINNENIAGLKMNII